MVARAVNDPSQLQSLDPSASVHIEPGEVDNLGDLLDDYLQHLPFREGVIGPDLDRDAWVQMSPAERDQTLSSINQTLRFLESYYRDLDRWIRCTRKPPRAKSLPDPAQVPAMTTRRRCWSSWPSPRPGATTSGCSGSRWRA